MRKEDILELIANGDIRLEYMEDDNGDPLLGIEYKTDLLKDSINENDVAEYVSECLLVASLAGFEAPTEYYRFMKAFVEDQSLDDITEAMEEDFRAIIEGRVDID